MATTTSSTLPRRDDRIELLAAAIAPQSANAEQRTIDVVFFSGGDVDRVDYFGDRYTLRFDPAGADLSLLNNGAPVLDGHSTYGGASDSQKGVVVKAWKDAAGWMATLRFSKRPEVDGLWGDVQDGIVTKFSMGVELLATTEQRDQNDKLTLRTVTSWRPFEISTVPVPADWGTTSLKGNTMETTTTTQEQLSAAIKGKVKLARLPETFAETLITEKLTEDQASTRILNELAKKSDAIQINSHIAITRDRADGLQERMGEYLACRYSGAAPSEGAKEFSGARVADLARELLALRGVRVNNWAAETHIREALYAAGSHTTSDFPNLTGVLTVMGTRTLLMAYQAAQGAVKQVARRSTANDFRSKMALRLGAAPALLKVNEKGEVSYGSRAESAESYKLATYGRIFGISRNALVNDDLSAFHDFTGAYGVAAASLESNVLVDTLYGAAGVGPTMTDGTALFASGRGNLAGSGGAIGDTTLTAARLALRTTKDLDNSTVIEVAPRYLLVPAAKETEAQKAIAAIYPATTSTANVFQGALTALADPRLDSKSATRWWLFGDPQLAPVLEYSYLGEAQGPMVEARPGWETLGVEIRCVLDFGAGAIGVRGAYCNPGA